VHLFEWNETLVTQELARAIDPFEPGSKTLERRRVGMANGVNHHGDFVGSQCRNCFGNRPLMLVDIDS
jgi:hypothetical protein